MFKPTELQIARAKQILNVDYRPHDMCVECALSHHDEKGLEFKTSCIPLKYDADKVSLKKEDDVWEAIVKSPKAFAALMNIDLRDFQDEILMCAAPRKVLRITRQAGKTWAMAMGALHYAYTHGRSKVLIASPYDSQMLNLFNIMSSFISASDFTASNVLSKGTTGRLYTKDPYTIRLKNGSTITGFAVEQKKATNARGNSADFIIIDEMDYMGPDAIVAIMATMAGNPKTELMVASTPSGIRGQFYDACHSPIYKEFHWSYQELPNYSVDRDAEFKRTMSKEDYEREILAEFTLHQSGVFPDNFIDTALADVQYEANSDGGTYTIGVDWNETATGVQIVVLKYVPQLAKFKVALVTEIPPSMFTQLEGVNRIRELNDLFNPRYIYVDNGFGETQIQLLHRMGIEEPKTHLDTRVVGISFGGNVTLADPVTHNNIEMRVKNFVVSLAVRYLERNMLILPRMEDMPRSLVGQMRRYEIIGFSPDGAPRYSEGNDHKLDAFVLALYAMWKLSPDSDQQPLVATLAGAPQKVTSEESKWVLGDVQKAKPTSIYRRLNKPIARHQIQRTRG